MTAALTFTHVTRTEKGAAAPLLRDASFIKRPKAN